MQFVHQSLDGTCVASCSFSFLLRRSVPGSSSHTPVGRCQFFFTICLLLLLTFRLLLLQLHSILFLQLLPIFRFQMFHLHTVLPTLQACRKRFDHSPSLPAENCTCFIDTNPHVHCVHSVVHVQFDHRYIASISNVRICCIQHHGVSKLDNFLHCVERLDNTRTSECFASLNTVVCLEWNNLYAPVSDLLTIRCHQP